MQARRNYDNLTVFRPFTDWMTEWLTDNLLRGASVSKRMLKMFSYTASRSDSLWKFKCYPNRRVLDLFTRVKLCTAVSAPAAWWHLSWHWHRPGQKSTGTLLPLFPLCWSKFSQAKSFRNSIAYEMEDGGRLNNNVLIFDPGHWFLVSCLQV